tara:strand:+ start:331 stop:555 length:225 start_codon:yes stop_codon:yes gene_type:complete
LKLVADTRTVAESSVAVYWAVIVTAITVVVHAAAASLFPPVEAVATTVAVAAAFRPVLVAVLKSLTVAFTFPIL